MHHPSKPQVILHVPIGLDQRRQYVNVSFQLNHFVSGCVGKLDDGCGSRYLDIDTHRPSLIGLLLFCVQIVFPQKPENLKRSAQRQISIEYETTTKTLNNHQGS